MTPSSWTRWASYGGYIADATRIFCIGTLPKKLEDAFEVTLEIEKAIARELRPGRTGKDASTLLHRRRERLWRLAGRGCG